MPTSKPTYRTLGCCIYCGARDVRLTDEHIIPFALNGRESIDDASCDACGLITKRIEQQFCRDIYGALRAQLNYRTRRPKERPAVAKAWDRLGVPIEVPVKSLPTTYVTLFLPEPDVLLGRPPVELSPEMQLEIRADVGRDVLASPSVEYFHSWGVLCHLLAKIGHAAVCATIGREGYEPLLIDYVLGRAATFSHVVGGGGPLKPDVLTYPLQVVLERTPFGDYLVVYVSLFDGRMSGYKAVAGRVTDMDRVVRGRPDQGLLRQL